jgi:carboxylate-amine ligase
VAVIDHTTGSFELSHNFGAGTPYRVGVEEELFLVDPATHELTHATDRVLDAVPRFVRGRIVGEMCDGVIELATPVCANAADATRRLAALRQAACAPDGPSLLGAGVHPTTPHGAVGHRPGRHYDRVSAETRCLLRQSAYCGVHVHVGMPDPETAIAAFNGMRKWVPMLHALSANSPFWFGRDSGLASARMVLCHAVPRTGLPPAFAGFDDYRRTVEELVRTGELDGAESIWWDMRPHPRLGTLEVRLLDAQSSLADLEGLVALVHGLVIHEALVADPQSPGKMLLDEATFRAVRDGLDARLSVGGRMRHVQELAHHAIDLARPHVARSGAAASLQHLDRLLALGNGAVRQRAAYDSGGMPAVLAHLAQETCPSHPESSSTHVLAQGAA